MGTFAKAAVFILIGLMVLTLFVPSVRQLLTRVFSNSETLVLPDANGSALATGVEGEVKLVTLLGYDAIPAILSPVFVDAERADFWMDPDEQVLGLSINDDNRAYSIRMLSRHEIVNDVVGGVPVAVTW